MTFQNFGAWLAQELEQRGWTMGELARRCNVSHPAISRVVSGQHTPGVELCCAIANALEMPEEKILRLVGHLSPLPTIEEDSTFAEVYDMMKHFTPEQRRAILEYVEWRYRRAADKSSS